MQYQCLTFSHLSWSRILMNIPVNASKLLYIVPAEQFWESCSIDKVTTESYWKTFSKLNIFWLGAQVVFRHRGLMFQRKNNQKCWQEISKFLTTIIFKFQIIFILLKMFCTLPVTFCKSEIKFSFMRRFRDLLWGSMKMKRLTACNTKKYDYDYVSDMKLSCSHIHAWLKAKNDSFNGKLNFPIKFKM